MQIDREDLEAATKQGIITTQQAQQLISFWGASREHVPTFRLVHVMYYFGGFLAISAISLFVTQAWDLLVGMPLFLLSLLLFAIGLLLTQYFSTHQFRIPAAITATFSLVTVPLAVYNLQRWLGYIPDEIYHYADYQYYVSWYWMPMELTTLVVGAIMLYIYRYPFLLFPIAVTLWYMSMDLFPLLMHLPALSWHARALFSLYFGLVIIAAALYMDLKYSNNRQDYAFWLYIFGVMAFWGGLTSLDSNSELSKFLYCMINVLMILISVFLDRRVFAVFGAFGVLGYLGHLAFSVFQFSLFFPLVLVFLGLFIIYAATCWSRVEGRLLRSFDPYIPSAIKRRRDI